MKRTKYVVEYGGEFTARFSDNYHAQRFAYQMSRSHGLADIYETNGIIGQWRFGKATLEFNHLNSMAFVQ